MEEIRRVHLWEMIRYDPNIFFVLEATSKKLKMMLESDESYMHYYLEEMHDCKMRDRGFLECRAALVSYSKFLFNPRREYHISVA